MVTAQTEVTRKHCWAILFSRVSFSDRGICGSLCPSGFLFVGHTCVTSGSCLPWWAEAFSCGWVARTFSFTVTRLLTIVPKCSRWTFYRGQRHAEILTLELPHAKFSSDTLLSGKRSYLSKSRILCITCRFDKDQHFVAEHLREYTNSF